MGVRSRSKRPRGASAGAADLWSGRPAAGVADTMGGTDDDRISGLCDDVLVRILDLLPDAGDAVRTGALSRRWRGLWTRAGSLTFDSSTSSGRRRLASVDERFLDSVNSALAQRAKTTTTDGALDLEHLAISFVIGRFPADILLRETPVDLQPIQRCADAAQEWICYAMEKGVKSFVLKLRLFSMWKTCHSRETGGMIYLVQEYVLEQPVINLKDLPGSAKLETMHWDLKDVRVRLPDAAVFASLVDLSLENVDFGAGSGHLLSRLLSSACCPSLQKLQLRNLMLMLMKELLIESSTLLELTVMSNGSPMAGPRALKLKTPSLRILRLEDCDRHGMRVGISAPKLEELIFLPGSPDHIEVDGELPCMERLKVIDLYEDEHDVNESSICLLSRCTSVTCLEVSLKLTMGEGFVENITERIPHLTHLISLTVHVYSRKLHSLFGVGLAEILKQCNHIKYLRVHCTREASHNNDSFCDHLDHWKSHQAFHQIYLANIEEVEFTGLAGFEYGSWFMKRVLAHTRQLQKVAVSFDPRFKLYTNIDDSMLVPCTNGRWICHDPGLSYEWNRGPN